MGACSVVAVAGVSFRLFLPPPHRLFPPTRSEGVSGMARKGVLTAVLRGMRNGSLSPVLNNRQIFHMGLHRGFIHSDQFLFSLSSF